MARFNIEKVPREKYSFLWYPFVPFGAPTIFQGQAGYGKTTLLCKIMAEASCGVYPPRLLNGMIHGRPELSEWQRAALEYLMDDPSDLEIDESTIQRATVNGMEVDGIDCVDEDTVRESALPIDRPFMRPCGEPIKAAYISRENHYGNIIRAKYEEYGGRKGFLSVEDEADGLFTTTVDNIRRLTGDAKLVIVDPIFPFIEGRLSSNEDVARAMRNFDVVARETGAAYILLNNLTKNGSSDIDAGIGASNLKNIARSLFKIDRVFDRFGRIDYIRYSQLERAIEEMSGLEDNTHKHSGRQQQRAEALLQNILSDGPVEHILVKQKAEAAGISSATLNRAKRECGVTSKRISRDSSVWMME